MSHDDPHEDRWDSRNQLDIAVEDDLGETVSYKISGRAKGDFYGDGHVDEDVDLEVYESYVNWYTDRFNLKIGDLVVHWGKMDELVVTDNVNAQDLDQFVLPWKEDRKLAAPMVQGEIFLGDSTLELIVSPRPFIDRITFFNSDWALFRHNREVGADLAPDAATADFFRNLGVTADAPGWGDTEYGGRLRSTVGDVDFALSALLYHQRTPVFTGDTLALGAAFDPKQALALLPGDPDARAALLGATSPEITARYPWLVTLGGELETTLGDYGVRAEISHTRNARFQTADLGVAKADQTLLGVGADVTINAFYANLQAVQQWVHEDQALLVTRKQATTLTLLLEYEMLRGTVTPALYVAWDLGDNSAYLRPRVLYKATDHLTMDLGLYLISGDTRSVIGNFDANDEAYLMLTFSF